MLRMSVFSVHVWPGACFYFINMVPHAEREKCYLQLFLKTSVVRSVNLDFGVCLLCCATGCVTVWMLWVVFLPNIRHYFTVLLFCLFKCSTQLRFLPCSPPFIRQSELKCDIFRIIPPKFMYKSETWKRIPTQHLSKVSIRWARGKEVHLSHCSQDWSALVWQILYICVQIRAQQCANFTRISIRMRVTSCTGAKL